MGARPLEGEQDCLLGLPFGTGSIEEDRELGAPGLPLEAERGLSGTVVLKFGGASSEKPGISEGFHGLDFTVGDVPREGTGFLDVVVAGLLDVKEDDLDVGADKLDAVDGVVGRRVGVDVLGVDLGGGTVGLEVGVEDLAVDLDNGVVDLEETVVLDGGTVGLTAKEIEDLAAETVGLAAETVDLAVETVGLAAETVVLFDGKVALEVGVEGLEDLDGADNVGRPVGVAGLDPGPPDDDGLRIPALEEFNPGDKAACLDAKLLLTTGSGWWFAN